MTRSKTGRDAADRGPDDKSREYEPGRLREMDDGRFSAACRETLVFQFSCWLALCGILGLAWMICPEDAAGSAAILGMPVWYVLGAAALGLVFVLWTIFALRFENTMTLDAREEEEADACRTEKKSYE